MKKLLATLVMVLLLACPVSATVSDTERPVKVYSSGTATEYTIPFEYISDSDIKVTLVDSTTLEETKQTLDVDYTIVGSTVTYSSAPGAGYMVVIKRVTPYTQEAAFSPGEAPPLSVYESAYDKLTLIAQDLDERLSRAWLLPEYTTTTYRALPDPSTNNGKGIRVTADGDGFEAYELTDGLTVNLAKLSDYDDFATMVSTVGSTSKTIIIDTVGTLGANTVIPHTMHLIVLGGGQIVSNGYTITINGPFEAPPVQVFSGFDPGEVTGLWETRPEWFGAVGDGETDDTVAVKAALGSVVSGGLVHFRPKTYTCSTWTSYTPTGDLFICGTDPQNTVVTGVLDQTFISSSYHLSIQNMSLMTFKYVVSLAGGAGKNITMERLIISDVARALDAASTSTPNQILMRHCEITDHDIAVFIRSASWNTISILDNFIHDAKTDSAWGGIIVGQNSVPTPGAWSRTIVSGNTIKNIVKDGADTETHGILVYGERAIITNNHLEYVQNGGTDECEGIYTKCKYALIEGNTLYNAGLIGGAISIKGSGYTDTSTSKGHNVSCKNNRIIFDDDDFTNAVGINVETDGAIVEGNYIQGAGGSSSGVASIYVTSHVSDIVIKNNYIKDNLGLYAIKFRGYQGDNVAIVDNIINGVAGGVGIPTAYPSPIYIALSTASETTDNVNITGNIIKSGATLAKGILIETSAGHGLTNLNVSNNKIGACDKGISISAADSAIDNVFISGNMAAYVTSPILLAKSGTGTITDISARGNAGEQTERSGTATVPNGATYIDIVLTSPAVIEKTIQDVQVTPTNNMGNSTKFWVTSPNQNTIRINVDADPGPGTATFAWRYSLAKEWDD